MICTGSIQRIAKCALFGVLILFHLCLAQDEVDFNLENHEGKLWKSPGRHLLWSRYSSSSMNGTEVAIYIIAVLAVTIIATCCKYCLKQGCQPTDEYSDAVLHPPPSRQILSVPVLPSSGRRVLNPPRTSSSIILPPDDGVYVVGLTGIENPNYNPSIQRPVPSFQDPIAPQYFFSSTYQNNTNPTPLLDLPPSYESAVQDQIPKEFDKPPKYN